MRRLLRPRAPRVLIVAIAVVSAVLLIGSTGPTGDSSGSELRMTANTTIAPTTLAPTTSTSTTTSTTLAPATTTAPSTTAMPSTVKRKPTTTSPPPTPPPTTAAPAPPAPPPPPPAGIGAYGGKGVWVDAFDFNPGHSNNKPAVRPEAVDAMAAAGAKTLYIQAARSQDSVAPGDLMAPELLAQFLIRAHSKGMAVVAWYLPKLADLGEEHRHLSAILNFAPEGHRFDGVGLDIEWRAGVSDVALRNDRLVELSQWLRSVAVGVPLGAIVVSPVVTDVVNTNFWPNFPWTRLVPSYDVWMTMGYWSDRKSDSPYRDAYTNVIESVQRLRGHVGPVPIHPIGGIGNLTSDADYAGFTRGANELGVIGRSIYDWATSGAKGVTAIG